MNFRSSIVFLNTVFILRRRLEMANEAPDPCPVCLDSGFLLNETCPLCVDAASHDDAASAGSSPASRSDATSVYDDQGDREVLFLLPPPMTRWSSGSHVRCNRLGKGVYHTGRVTHVNRDGSYNIVYKSGMVEYNVPSYRTE